MTSVNMSDANRIYRLKKDIVKKRLSMQFLNDHEKTIEKVAETVKNYTIEAPSTQLGILKLDEIFSSVASKNGIRDVLTEFKPVGREDRFIYLKMVFSTSPVKGFAFLEELRKEYGFVTIRSLSVIGDKHRGTMDFVISLKCNLRIVDESTVSGNSVREASARDVIGTIKPSLMIGKIFYFRNRPSLDKWGKSTWDGDPGTV